MADVVEEMESPSASVAGRTRDAELRSRAERVIPDGMYGHLAVGWMPANYPQFFARGDGCRVWDVDGREFIDFMCAWGPMVVGYRNPVVEAAFRAELEKGAVLDGPSASMVELAELLVDQVAAADWVMFNKNGNDATALGIAIARAATERERVLIARGSYHGISPWCVRPGTPGVTKAEEANRGYFEWNDLESVDAALAASPEPPAAIVVTPIRHDIKVDLELPDPEFATGLRERCDRIGALLFLDEVRTSLRLDLRGAWEQFGVRPDLSAFSKSLANGHAIAALTGADAIRDVPGTMYSTGSFWFQSPPMAAAIATIEHLRDSGGQERMRRAGERFQAGLREQARAHDLAVVVSGPPTLPFMRFERDDDGRALAYTWAEACGEHGVFIHPIHNWFISSAHDDAAIDKALEATDVAFAAVREQFGAD